MICCCCLFCYCANIKGIGDSMCTIFWSLYVSSLFTFHSMSSYVDCWQPSSMLTTRNIYPLFTYNDPIYRLLISQYHFGYKSACFRCYTYSIVRNCIGINERNVYQNDENDKLSRKIDDSI